MIGSSCILFVPDDTAKTGLPEPLMLRRVAGAPVLRHLAWALAEGGMQRAFLVCHDAYLERARACFPEQVALTVSGGENPADLLHVFLSTDEDETEELLVVTGPALCAEHAPAGLDFRTAPTCSLSVLRDDLMQALDEDFNFAAFLRENGRIADGESQLYTVTGAEQLSAWQPLLRAGILNRLARTVVEIYDPANCYVEPDVQVGAGTVLLPGTILRGKTAVGANCTIGPNALLEDAQAGDGCTVNASQLVRTTLGQDCAVGPFASLRDCTGGSGVHVGAGASLCRVTLSAHASAGAGCVSAAGGASDERHIFLGQEAAVGAGSCLIAPVSVGERAAVAAGSVITEDVPAQQLAAARARQVNRRSEGLLHRMK